MPTKLYVGNLPHTCSEDAIHDLFTSYGDIVELAVKGNYAFVHFKQDEDAANAVRDLNGTKMLGNKITVEISKSKRDGSRMERINNPSRDFNNHQNQSFNRALECGPTPNLIAPSAISDLGILSAVTQLAAVAERQRMATDRSMDPLQKQVVPDSRKSQSDKGDVGSKDNGFVIYERYYIDPSHVLLKGLPIPKVPHIQGNSHSNYSQGNNRHNCKYDGEYRR